MFDHRATKTWILGLAMAAVIAASSACTTRSLRLVNLVIYPQAPQRLFAVSEIRVDAPLKGRNVFNFADLATGNTMVCGGGSCGASLRATFKYLLEEDSAPLFKQAMEKGGLTLDPSSPLKADVKVQFGYFLADRGSLSNELTIHVELALSIRDAARLITNATYTRNEAERYNSGFVTFPRSGTLNSLFNKALSSIVSQMSADERLRSSIERER